jgi:hypothetical protein
MPDLLHSAMLAIQKGESGGRSMSYVQKLVILIIPALVKALKKVILSTMQYIWHIFSIDVLCSEISHLNYTPFGKSSEQGHPFDYGY